jgi:hypothetical protein
VVLADGAEWIWHQARCQLGVPGVEVIEILDFYHASQHLAQVAAAIYGAESAVGQHWLDKQCHALRHQGVAPVLAALDRLHPRKHAAAKVLRLTRAYLADHAQRADYPAFRARLLPIGSGAIEGTVKNLIQARAVQAGMRWDAGRGPCPGQPARLAPFARPLVRLLAVAPALSCCRADPGSGGIPRPRRGPDPPHATGQPRWTTDRAATRRVPSLAHGTPVPHPHPLRRQTLAQRQGLLGTRAGVPEAPRMILLMGDHKSQVRPRPMPGYL